MTDDSANVLVVDDEPLVLKWCGELLKFHGYSVTCASDMKSALKGLQETDFEVAVIDLRLSGASGLDLVRKAKEVKPQTEVVIMTGNPSLESSLEAIEHRVFAYVLKPAATELLLKAVRSASEHYRLARENENLIEQLKAERSKLRERVSLDQKAMQHLLQSSPELVGVSDAVEEIRRQIAEVAPSDMTVLLRGESGTGKDVVARLINGLSGRSNAVPLVKINCPAIPETLLESELFGHERGAFTGAERRKPGRFELASGGNIFLDEIAEIPVSLQAKLLQVIEHKEFCRLGETTTRRVNARILAATNAPLEDMIADGTFRGDLFYRLNDYTIYLPPLREHLEDIPILVEHFIRKHAAPLGHQDLQLSSESMDALRGYSWPGNIRELESVIRRFALTASEETVRNAINGSGVAHSRPVLMPRREPEQQGHPVPPPASPPSPPAPPAAFDESDAIEDSDGHSSPSPLSASVRAAEADRIREALEQMQWNRRKAAALLGISYSTMRRKITACGIKKPRSGS